MQQALGGVQSTAATANTAGLSPYAAAAAVNGSTTAGLGAVNMLALQQLLAASGQTPGASGVTGQPLSANAATSAVPTANVLSNGALNPYTLQGLSGLSGLSHSSKLLFFSSAHLCMV